MGLVYMFEDERFVSPGHHDDVDSVNVPGKTMTIHCGTIGDNDRAVDGKWTMTGAHLGGENFNFIDGHAATFDPTPVKDWWEASIGAPGTFYPYGLLAFTYPPQLNTEGSRSEAKWWVPPAYPEGPIYYNR